MFSILMYLKNFAELLQSYVSHDPLESILICWFLDQETFLVIIYVENSCDA